MPRKIILAGWLIVTCIAPGLAQVKGKLSGVVMDAQGNPVEKATVTIVSSRRVTEAYELTTSKEGHFVQVGLQPGYFQVTVKKTGYAPKVLEAKVSMDAETKLDFKLETADAVAQRSLSEADKLFLQGNKLYSDQKYAEAAGAYEEAVKLSQTNWGYYLNLGLSYKKLEKRPEALAAFRKAVEISPESYSATKELGEALGKDGNFAEAKTYYQKAVDLSPDDPDAHYNLGACLTNTGEQDAALAHFQKVAELKPDYADAYYQIGTIYIGLNKVPEAVQSLERFLELAPNHEKAQLARQLLQYLKK
jgi:tetratricopeptide (TPR) repeat protein